MKLVDKYPQKKGHSDGCIIILLGYARSSLQGFEILLRLKVSLDEDDLQLIAKQWKSIFITYETPTGIYAISVLPEVVYTMKDYEGTLQIEYDDISLKTKIILIRSGGTLGTLEFDQRSFFYFLEFTSYWDCKLPHTYTCEKIENLSTINKIHIKSDVIDGFLENGIKQRFV